MTKKEQSDLVVHVSKKRHDLIILQALRRIIRAIDIHSRQLSAKYNITAPQLICLLTIVENKKISVATLAKEIYLSPSTVVGVLDRLEDKKLIIRKRDKKDRRVVIISASAKGKEYSKSAPSPLQDKLANALLDLSELEQMTISLSLNRIVALMEAEDIDAAPILETGKIQE